jgi:DNA topoisomerase VI subunit B
MRLFVGGCLTPEPIIDHDRQPADTGDGTTMRIDWADDPWPFEDDWKLDRESELIQQLVVGFHFFNPHARFYGSIFGEDFAFEPSCDKWNKWKPSNPTCPHWYELAHLQRLIAAYITQERRTGVSRTAAEFVREFKGLTGTAKAKAVLEDCGLLRVRLSDLAGADGLDNDRIQRLLDAMKRHSKIVKPSGLGIIGQSHFRNVLLGLGCVPESITYQKKLNDENGIPYVLESAFGWLGDGAADRRKIHAGANWSSAIKQPFRSFGATGEGLEALLSKQFASQREPIVFAIHLTYPRIEYTDRGKSAIALGRNDHWSFSRLISFNSHKTVFGDGL